MFLSMVDWLKRPLRRKWSPFVCQIFDLYPAQAGAGAGS
jgi:hypothetical protein